MSTKSNTAKIRQMVIIALLSAIIVLLGFTPIGYLRIGPMTITFLTVPVIIGAIMLGPVSGTILGTIFGLTSLVQCFMGDPFGATLLGISMWKTVVLCIVPRALMGLFTALIFIGLKKMCKGKSIAPYLATSLCGACLNTIMFMGTLMFLFGSSDFITGLQGGKNVLLFLVGFVGLQGVLEAAVAGMLGTAVSRVLYGVVNKN